ncbi:hypothetical protein [Rummeliibacillus suwonensis]|uniref:hypothetical protein n=1 Tax=Rummeliibacillus suwonensis TaxID=1306154 RepID=UPI0028A074F4|nr:hypothetical protein [Rummeliibacillus suwonensis]
MSRKKIQRVMRKYGIVYSHRRPNPNKQMAKAKKELRVVPNQLKREFKQGILWKVLLTDTCFLYNGNNMVYLSSIKDASTNKVLAYHFSYRITLEND